MTDIYRIKRAVLIVGSAFVGLLIWVSWLAVEFRSHY